MILVNSFNKTTMQVVNGLVLQFWLAQKVFGRHPAPNAIGADNNQRVVGEKFSFTGADVGQGNVQPANVELIEFPFITHVYHGSVRLSTQGVEVGEGDIGVGKRGHQAVIRKIIAHEFF